MNRTLQITIDAGDTTCDGCEHHPEWWWCEQYDKELDAAGGRACDCLRLPECLAAEVKPEPVICERCGGARFLGSNVQPCPRCAGTGRVSP